MTAAHLDYDALADFAEGILDEATAASTERHLAGCADCRMRAAEVAEVSRVLADAPLPPMPAHLVERLDAALAAEAASSLPVHRQARRFQLVAAAAAAVVAVGGGAVAVRTVIDQGDSRSAAVSQPPVEEPSRTDSKARPQVARPAPYAVVRTGTDYTTAGLASQVATALSKTAPAGRPHAMNAVSGPSEACVARVTGGKAPLLVDAATYDGRPAAVIVLRGADAGHADVWVVGPKCSVNDLDLVAHRQVTR